MLRAPDRTLVVAVTCLLASCAARQSGTDTPSAELELEVKRPVVIALDLAGRTAQLGFTVRNPSTLSARLSRVEWQTTLEGGTPTTGAQDLDLTVAPGAEHTADLPLTIALPFNAAALEPGGTTPSLSYTVTGTFFVESGAGVIDEYLFDQRGTVLGPALPTTMASAAAARFEGMVELRITLTITNPNAFEIPLDELRYAITAGGTEIAAAAIGQNDQIGASATLEYEIVRLIGKKDHFDLAKKMLGMTHIPWTATGETEIQGVKLGWQSSGEVVFSETTE